LSSSCAMRCFSSGSANGSNLGQVQAPVYARDKTESSQLKMQCFQK
jgi:hypothetical protein